MLKEANVKAIYLKDYKSPDFVIHKINLTFDLNESATVVESELFVSRKTSVTELVLNGENLKLLKVFINNEELTQYKLDEQFLTLKVDSNEFIVKTIVEINPIENTALEGLYLSDGTFCTQNEPEGFRKITYFLDRPDNMAIYHTKIIADKEKYPILLSNGNKIDSGDLADGKHFVVWSDPFPKPSYLYALVAGDLGLVSDTFTTMSGRKINLEIYVDKGNEDQCGHAMESLKNSMKWDEEKFGLEYDLEIYMIVAVDAFNMGAMENKGLNIFNSKYVLAKQDTATDDSFEGVESVIGHEYFHNWTGNRVTCRDWFQLTLKEGLTVYRDQEFSADMSNRAVKRISDVQRLKEFQFREDAGPMSHPIKPKSYIEMNNFYTATVYEKGAEVIRMIETLIGKEIFRKGMDKYFELYDGQAVTTEDFVHAMELASGKDLTQFKLWYDQHGTPKVKIKSEYSDGKLILKFEQLLVQSSINDEIEALHIPIRLAFFGNDGSQLKVTDEKGSKSDEFLIELREKSSQFTFNGFDSYPILSLNRGFSAPIKIDYQQGINDNAVLMAHDSDSFNRWNATQQMMIEQIMKIKNGANELSNEFCESFKQLLSVSLKDPYFYAFSLDLPSESVLNDLLDVCDFDGVSQARSQAQKLIANIFETEFVEIYSSIKFEKFSISGTDIGLRKLKNVCLKYLAVTQAKANLDKVYEHYRTANNMTDESSSLSMLIHFASGEQRQKAIDDFINKWSDEFLVKTSWFAMMASYKGEDSIEKMIELEQSKHFDYKNPNMLRSLYGTFGGNLTVFNKSDGSGYQFMRERIQKVDAINPQVASRLATSFSRINRVSDDLKILMVKELKVLSECSSTSKDTLEIVNRFLG